MRRVSGSVLKWGAGILALFAGYEIYQHNRPLADRAAVGDEVFVNPAMLPGGLPPSTSIPANAAALVLTIKSATSTAFDGQVTGFAASVLGVGGAPTTLVQNVPGLGVLSGIPRTAIMAVRRNGTMLA